MALDPDESTHRVATRQPEGVKDWDDTGRIAVENRVVEALVPYGTAVHLSAAPDAERLGGLTEQLARVGEDGRVLPGARSEYRASLPADADALLSGLAVAPGDTDAWVDRLHDLHEFAVVTPDAWLYRSVPHHAHIRELNADGSDGALAAVVDELDVVPRSGVVPVDGLASWRSGGVQYELTWDALRRRAATDDGGDPGDDGGDPGDDGGGRWTAFDPSRLRRVSPRPDRAELVVRWKRPSADSWPRRLFRRALAPESVDPPTRIEFPDSQTMADAVEALEELKTKFEYRFAVEEP